MKKTFLIRLNDTDLGQAIDGLHARAKDWENTAYYLRSGKAPEKFFVAQECNGLEEASRLSKHYRSILRKIEKQIKAQQ